MIAGDQRAWCKTLLCGVYHKYDTADDRSGGI